jgi:hypothetical protein
MLLCPRMKCSELVSDFFYFKELMILLRIERSRVFKAFQAPKKTKSCPSTKAPLCKSGCRARKKGFSC